MNKLYSTCKIMSLVLFILIISPVSAGESPYYGPFSNDTIEIAETNPWFIAIRGTLPEMTNDAEKIEWSDSLFECSNNLREIDQYFMKNGGPVIFFGYSGEAYIEVGLDTEYREKVNESTIDEIYQVIANHCEKEGISDVPVVFVWGHIVETGESTSDLFDEEKNENETKQQTPGFTPVMLVLSLILLIGMQRR